MIDIDNYTRAIEWLRRSLTQLDGEPDNPVFQVGVLQSFEVTYNLSESILRHVYVALSDDSEAAHLSARELIWRAGEEGLVFASRREWMEYGLELETMRDACILSVGYSSEDVRSFLFRYVRQLESFADSITRKLAAYA